MRSQLSNTPCIRRELDLCGIRPALFVHEVPELLDLAWVKEWCVSNVSKRMLRYEITTLSINHVKVECQRVNVSFIKTQWKNQIIWDYILQLYMQMLLISPVTHPRYPNGHQATCSKIIWSGGVRATLPDLSKSKIVTQTSATHTRTSALICIAALGVSVWEAWRILGWTRGPCGRTSRLIIIKRPIVIERLGLT